MNKTYNKDIINRIEEISKKLSTDIQFPVYIKTENSLLMLNTIGVYCRDISIDEKGRLYLLMISTYINIKDIMSDEDIEKQLKLYHVHVNSLIKSQSNKEITRDEYMNFEEIFQNVMDKSYDIYNNTKSNKAWNQETDLPPF